MQDFIILFNQYVELCQHKGIALVVVFRPEKGELDKGKYYVDFAPLKDFLVQQNGVYVFDLSPFLKNYTVSNGVLPEDLYWKLDGHHNTKGYEVMAQGIYEYIKPILDSLDGGEKTYN